MNKRRYTKASDWQPIIEEWKQSGLSKKNFCEQKAINYKLFYRWYSKLTASESTGVSVIEKAPLFFRDFIPVETARPSKATASTTACILHLSSQLQLHIPLSAIGRDFLQTLFEAAGVKSC